MYFTAVKNKFSEIWLKFRVRSTNFERGSFNPNGGATLICFRNLALLCLNRLF